MMIIWINEISAPGDLEELQAIPEDIWQTKKTSTAKFMLLNVKHFVLLVLTFIPKIFTWAIRLFIVFRISDLEVDRPCSYFDLLWI